MEEKKKTSVWTDMVLLKAVKTNRRKILTEIIIKLHHINCQKNCL